MKYNNVTYLEWDGDALDVVFVDDGKDLLYLLSKTKE